MAHEPCDHMKMWGPNTAIGGQKMKLGKAHIRLWPLEMQRKETDNTDETGVLGECFSKVHFVFWFGFMVGCLFFFFLLYFYFWKGAEEGVSEEHRGLLDVKQTFLVHVTTDADIPCPSLPVSVWSPEVIGTPPGGHCGAVSDTK